MTAHFFSGLFTPPRARSKNPGGIEISERWVKYLELVSRGTHREIGTYGRVALSAGVIVDGDIRDASAVMKALAEVRSRTHLSEVHASLPDAKARLFTVVVPHGTKALLAEDIALPLSEHSPLPFGETVFGYEEIFSGSRASSRTVVVAAFPKKIAGEYRKVFDAAGFTVLSLELASQAAARVAAFSRPPSVHEARLIIGIASSETIFSIVHRGTVCFTTTAKSDLRPSTSLNMHAANLLPEVNRIRMFWHARPAHAERDGGITSAVIYGDGTDIDSLAKHLSLASGMPVSPVDFRAVLGAGTIPPMQKEESPAYAVALGLALKAGKSRR